MAGVHRVSASCAQDGLVPGVTQSKLESVKEKIFLRCALRQRECGANRLSSAQACMLRHLRISQRRSGRGKISPQARSSQPDIAMPTIDRDGVNIYYELHGSGPPLILTHGYSSTSAMWTAQIDALSRPVSYTHLRAHETGR